MEIIWLHTGHENHRALLTWNLVHESNFHGALVINRWSNYSTYRYISAKHSWRIYFIGARLWCSTACEKKKKKKNSARTRQMFANSLAIRQSLRYILYFPYLFPNPLSNCFVLNFSAIEKKRRSFFFLSTNFFRFFFFFLVGNWQYLF